jgi:hypothetical protein
MAAMAAVRVLATEVTMAGSAAMLTDNGMAVLRATALANAVAVVVTMTESH